jgi:hypothetical protein
VRPKEQRPETLGSFANTVASHATRRIPQTKRARVLDKTRYPVPLQHELIILLDPVALLVLLVFLLYGAPGDPIGAILLAVLILCGVEGLLVDLLGVFGEVVLYTIRKLSDLLVGHLDPFCDLLEDTYPFRASGQPDCQSRSVKVRFRSL